MGSRVGAVVGTVVAIGLIAAGNAHAATFDVDTTVDSTHVAGCTAAPDDCSIRDALALTLTSPDTTDTIAIPAGTYVLTGDLVATDGGAVQTTVIIDGAGARQTTIDGAGIDRVFTLAGLSPTFQDLTITGGAAGPTSSPIPNDGGGLLVRSSTPEVLTLSSVAIRGNTATMAGGGISAPFEDPGLVDLVINDSTISGNTVTGGAASGQGGGIQAFGDLTVTNSTIAGNRVENPGAGMGAGIMSSVAVAGAAGNLTLLNSTIAGNSITDATGTGAGVTTFNPTMGAAGTLTVTNTVVAGNTVGGAAGDCSLVGAVTSDNNLSSDSSCQFADEGSVQSATDPGLGELADNGGPTDTLALRAGSPAIDAGTNLGCPPVDQRGVVRPLGVACDIGAFERIPDPVTPPTPPPPTGTKSADLSLTLKAKPKQPKVGGRLAYKVTVRNLGPDLATGAVLKGKLPASARKIKGGESCKLRKAKGIKRKFSCELGDLQAGSSTKVKMLARPDESTPKPRATAKVNSAVTDPDRSNNRAKAKVEIKGL